MYQVKNEIYYWEDKQDQTLAEIKLEGNVPKQLLLAVDIPIN